MLEISHVSVRLCLLAECIGFSDLSNSGEGRFCLNRKAYSRLLLLFKVTDYVLINGDSQKKRDVGWVEVVGSGLLEVEVMLISMNSSLFSGFGRFFGETRIISLCSCRRP